MPDYPVPSDETAQRPGLSPPQFGLRAIFATTTALAVILFALRIAGPLAAAALILLAAAILAHVAGNALGTRLRDQEKPTATGDNKPERVTIAQPHHFAPPTHLRHRQRHGTLAVCPIRWGRCPGSLLWWLALGALERASPHGS